MAYNKTENKKSEKAILKTLAYSDIFDFPLTKDELWEFLISEEEISRKVFDASLANLMKHRISQTNGYYFLNGQEKIVTRRIANRQYVEKKIKIAWRAAGYLSFIPTILCIGLSGGLAIGDASKDDDIDFFIITQKNRIFTTRFFVLFILELLGLRRKKGEKHAENKVCVNYFIDETKLGTIHERQDEYVAHEIVQMQALFDREAAHHKFLQENSWVKSFFPNRQPPRRKKEERQMHFFQKVLHFFATYLPTEWFFRLIQKEFMRKSITREIVTSHVLLFHPYDYRVQTLQKLRLKLQELGLLTKK